MRSLVEVVVRRYLLILSILLLIPLVGFAQQEAGKVVAICGQVAIQAQQWRPATLNQTVFEGNVIRTFTRSRVAVLLIDETQLKLNENTQIAKASVRHLCTE